MQILCEKKLNWNKKVPVVGASQSDYWRRSLVNQALGTGHLLEFESSVFLLGRQSGHRHFDLVDVEFETDIVVVGGIASAPPDPDVDPVLLRDLTDHRHVPYSGPST